MYVCAFDDVYPLFIVVNGCGRLFLDMINDDWKRDEHHLNSNVFNKPVSYHVCM